MIAARRRRLAGPTLLALACVALPAVAACGKKGPPLAPLVNRPVAPPGVSASRAAGEVTIRFTVPNANVSGVRPADIERVDVYAWTGPALQPRHLFKLAKVVASVPVRPPPPPEDETEGDAPPPPPPPRVGPGVDQGAPAELRETLSAEALQPIEPPDAKEERPVAATSHVTPPDVMAVPPPLTRRYVVVGVNRRGRRGTPAQPVAVPLWAPPPPPLAVEATMRESGTALTWTAPPNLRRPVMENALPPPPPATTPGPARGGDTAPRPARPDETGEPPDDYDDDDDDDDREVAPEEPPVVPSDASPAAAPPQAPVVAAQPEQTPAAPPGLTPSGLLPARPKIPWPAVWNGYHVYEISPPGQSQPAVPGGASGVRPLPRRLTTAPINATEYSDTRVEYGVERCYAVRTVEMVGDLAVESEASAPVCVKAADVFPPAPPKSLAAVASEGAISLIWEGNTEADLRGYVVLRAVAPGEPTERLTPEPIRESAFRDITATPGTRYVYAVIAVDTATPPNASAPSNRVEETAR